MKNTENTRQKGWEPYEVPALEVIEIKAEAGFAASGNTTHDNFEEEDYNW